MLYIEPFFACFCFGVCRELAEKRTGQESKSNVVGTACRKPPPSLKSSSSAKLNNSCRSVTMYTVQQPTGDANAAES